MRLLPGELPDGHRDSICLWLEKDHIGEAFHSFIVATKDSDLIFVQLRYGSLAARDHDLTRDHN